MLILCNTHNASAVNTHRGGLSLDLLIARSFPFTNRTTFEFRIAVNNDGLNCGIFLDNCLNVNGFLPTYRYIF